MTAGDSRLVFGVDRVCGYCRLVHRGECGNREIVADSEWASRFVAHVRHLAAGSLFTVEDITRAVGRPIRHGLVGSTILSLKRDGLVAFVGHDNAKRPERQGGVNLVWRRK